MVNFIVSPISVQITKLNFCNGNYVHPLGGGHIIFAFPPSAVPLGFQTF